VDDAHGLGLLSETQDSRVDAELYVGTLSKALGSSGGFVGGSREVIDLLFSRARSLIYSTALPPANLASALAALDLIEGERDLRARPVARAREFAAALGWPRPESAIVPWILGSAGAALEASERLARSGLLAVAIRPPTVPEGTARLRFSFTALHTPEHVRTLVRAVRALVGSR
jgi:8-amino-7-oxononanoate synthase